MYYKIINQWNLDNQIKEDKFMQIKKGRNRIVLMLPIIGIVIKIPNLEELFKLGLRKIIRGLRKHRSSAVQYIKFFLLSGIMANQREFCFYIKTRHPFLQPTYFSLFGLLNIQRLGQPYNGGENNLLKQLNELTNGAIWENSHHFNNPDNFCQRGGNLRIVDYGNQKVQQIIIKFGNKIFNDFDLEYHQKND